MYLHIGKDYILNMNEIIGIFDINSLKKTNCYDNIISNVENIEDISENKNKTLILIKENNKIKAYISNILSTTIASRNNF